MAVILDGIVKLEQEQLCYQIASLEEVTMTNVMSEMGQKAKKGTVKTVNFFRKIVGSEAISEPKVITMEERINRKKAELSALDKEVLLLRMQKELVEKLRSCGSDIAQDSSAEEISAEAVSVAVKCFKKGIPANLTTAQKADAVYHRYNERLIAQTKEKYDKMSDAEKVKMNETLQKDIQNMSAEQTEALQRALGVEEITGETIENLIKTTAGAATLMLALEASGFGAYIALTTIMHAIFTTTLGITLPFAVYTTATGALSFLLGPGGFLLFTGVQLFMLDKNKNKLLYESLAQVVWMGVMMCGGHMAPKAESLPSWLPPEQRECAQMESEELHGVQAENKELSLQIAVLQKQFRETEAAILQKEEKIRKLNEKMIAANQKEQDAKRNCLQLEEAVRNAEQRLREQQTKISALEETAADAGMLEEQKRAQQDLVQAQKQLSDAQKEADHLNASITALTEEVLLFEEEIQTAQVRNKELSAKNTEYEAKITLLQEKLEALTGRELKKLEMRWERSFKKFIFEPGVIKSVVKNYHYNEFGSIEGTLMELHEAKDPAAIRSNRGKMAGSGELHLEFSTLTGFPSRVFYKPIKNHGQGKTVSISEICKHNDARYGKK